MAKRESHLKFPGKTVAFFTVSLIYGFSNSPCFFTGKDGVNIIDMAKSYSFTAVDKQTS